MPFKPVDALHQAVHFCLAEASPRLAAFKDSGYSFEEWINWELYYACLRQGLSVLPKPAYNVHGPENSGKFGDLLVEQRYFLEVGLVHDNTGNKWQGKIREDRNKLRTLPSPSLTPCQLLVAVSDYDDVLQVDTWRPWLEELGFWNDKRAWEVNLGLPGGGQVLARAWYL